MIISGLHCRYDSLLHNLSGPYLLQKRKSKGSSLLMIFTHTEPQKKLLKTKNVSVNIQSVIAVQTREPTLQPKSRLTVTHKIM